MHIQTELPLVKSPFVQTVIYRDVAAIWHSLFGSLKILPIQTLIFLDEFRTPKSLNNVHDGLVDNNKMATVHEMLDSSYLISNGFDERAFLAQKMAEREASITNGSLICYLGLIVSEICNFRCDYCIHLKSLEISGRNNNSRTLMRFEVAKAAVDRYLSILRQHRKTVAVISFGGGEPLLAWPVIKKIIEYCLSTYGTKFTFHFSLTTNASLITPEIAQLLKQYQVELTSSIDGLREGNDRVRITRTGDGTFDLILTGLKNLESVGYPLQVIGMTVNEKNFPFLNERIIDWAAEHGISKIRIDADIIGIVALSVEVIAQKIMQIYRYAKTRGIEVSGYWARPAKNLNKSAIDPRGVAFCGAVRGNTLCVNPSGAIYGCGYSNIQLGTLSQFEFLCSPEQEYHRFVRNHLTGAMEMCRGCVIEGQCAGGCNITHESARATGTTKIKFMCDLYRRMTSELLIEQLHETYSGRNYIPSL